MNMLQETIAQDADRQRARAANKRDECESPDAETEAMALAMDWYRASGNTRFHPIYGQVHLGLYMHQRCVSHVAKLIRKKKDIEVVLQNIRTNIALDPESLRTAAQKEATAVRDERLAWEAGR